MAVKKLGRIWYVINGQSAIVYVRIDDNWNPSTDGRVYQSTLTDNDSNAAWNELTPGTERFVCNFNLTQSIMIGLLKIVKPEGETIVFTAIHTSVSTTQYSKNVITIHTNQDGLISRNLNMDIYPFELGDIYVVSGGSNNITINNSGNLKQVQIDSTIYSNFPVSVTINKDTIINANGVDDKVITVNYTGTKTPIVSNT